MIFVVDFTGQLWGTITTYPPIVSGAFWKTAFTRFYHKLICSGELFASSRIVSMDIFTMDFLALSPNLNLNWSGLFNLVFDPRRAPSPRALRLAGRGHVFVRHPVKFRYCFPWESCEAESNFSPFAYFWSRIIAGLEDKEQKRFFSTCANSRMISQSVYFQQQLTVVINTTGCS